MTAEQPQAPVLRIAALQVNLGPRTLRLANPCALAAGRLYLAVGRSGSGKSSFARALLGFSDLSDPPLDCRGDVSLIDDAGHERPLWHGADYDPQARELLAFLPQAERLGFLDGLTVLDNLSLFSRLEMPAAQREVERLAAEFQLHPLPTRLASASGGERIRLSAIRGLLPRGPAGPSAAVVIADEPTAGLDRAAAAAMVRLLSQLAESGQVVVVVITHEPEMFIASAGAQPWADEPGVTIVACPASTEAAHQSPCVVSRLNLEPTQQKPGPFEAQLRRVRGSLGRLGSLVLSPAAMVWGLSGLHRPLVVLRQVLSDAGGLGTLAFSLAGCLLIAGTVAYFVFERMPKPELFEPLLLPETLAVTGQALLRVVLPLAACSLVTAKLGAAQAARLAAAVRGGLLETLALASWRIEAYALVPAVIAQVLAMTLATALALWGGLFLAAVVYVAGHADASLPLTLELMRDGLEKSPRWTWYLTAKVLASGFLGGTIAAIYGIAPSRADDDVARAVHRTLLWSVLAVIACQCALVLAEFAR